MKQKSAKDKALAIVGRKEVVDAVEAQQPIQKIMIQKGITGEMEVQIRNLCKDHHIPFQVVPRQVLSKWSDAYHQGLIALRSPVRFYSASDVIDQAYHRGEAPLIIAMDGVKDVRNLGAIARSAEALGAHGLLFPAKGTAIINDFVIKSSAGAILNLPLIRTSSLENTLIEIKNMGLKIFGADGQAQSPLKNVDFTLPSAVVMGSEGEGLRPHIVRLLDHSFKIEQKGKVESLNVSVATGIILYEIFVQRNK
ncbi:MAG: 23S rRNA (guanosine(2251)-2'-O)-methyltransferase RlmB [Bacteroidetes bacterium]|jgi:23S rRNA (guanosine2251-2'-O)-methyltransferase|nr:23S rRNA (guanosine(2251)-2'-O)-methyltransferase RlmB [Bacteroidota bacterium]